MSSNFRKKDFVGLNALYLGLAKTEMAKGNDVDLEEYKDHGTFPTSFHKERKAQKKAVQILSKALADADVVERPLTTWNVPEDEEPEYESGNVLYFSDRYIDRFVFKNENEDVNFSLYWEGNENYRDDVLEDLLEGMDLDTSLENQYAEPSMMAGQPPYRQFKEDVLNEEGYLPDEIREDLEGALEVYRAEKIAAPAD